MDPGWIVGTLKKTKKVNMEVNLDDWYKPKIDKKTLKNLSKKKDLPGLLHFFFYFLLLFTSGYLAYLTLGEEHPDNHRLQLLYLLNELVLLFLLLAILLL